jgi:hypothetical protein
MRCYHGRLVPFCGGVMAGKMVASRRASIGLPAPVGPGSKHYGQNARTRFSVASHSPAVCRKDA